MVVDPLAAESLTATIGLDAILAANPRVTGGTRRRAARMPKAARQLIRRLIEQAKPERPRALPQMSYDATVKKLAPGIDAARGMAISEALVAPEVAASVSETAGRIFEALNTALPRRIRQTVTGETIEQPNEQDWAAFRRKWQIAMHPFSVLSRASSRQLTEADMAWFAGLWPAYAGYYATGVPVILATVNGGSESHRVPPLKEQMLFALTGKPYPMPMIQDVYLPPPPVGPTRGKPDVDVKDAIRVEQTQAQQTETPDKAA